MPTQIRITAGQVQLEAELNDSPTAKSVYLVSSERIGTRAGLDWPSS